MEAIYGRVTYGLAMLALALLFLMTTMITADVLLRNVPLIAGLRGLSWSNEVSESFLYLITLLMAPWLLRRGQHIRVDIVLIALPRHTAWYCEAISDVLGFICCLAMATYGSRSAIESYQSSAMTIKTLITPEWWLLAPLPIAFVLLAIEFIFRMRRLCLGERGPRAEAVSTG
ncbi:MAG: TRAP transporter small permease [Betaproteobacteria bacterium]|nr:MAG: TRAP transporter small permease [Betaproteobacteria bacterium]